MGRVFLGGMIGVYRCFYSRPILRITQIKGLRDPKGGCTFEPLALLGDDNKRALNSGPCQGKPGRCGLSPNSLIIKPLPPVTRALGVIGLSGRVKEVIDEIVIKY